VASNLRFSSTGELGKPKDPPRSPSWSGNSYTSAPVLTAFPASSRSLPGEMLAQAVVAGAFLPPGRIIVARENGLRVFSAATALPIADADLLGVDEKYGRCQPFAPEGGAVLAVCVQDEGGEVLDVSGALSRPKLEITFPETGVYIAGPRGRLGFTGRCGPQPPSGTDLGKGTPPPRESLDEDSPSPSATPSAEPPPAPPGLPDLPPADDGG
jgi:hypothetical protein